MKNNIDIDQYELYDNANRRIKQKKNLLNHFVVMIVGLIFMFIAFKWLDAFPQVEWFWWIFAIWLFLFILHFIRVFITEPFMGKAWEKKQMEKLVKLQEDKIAKIQAEIENQKK